MSEEFDRHLRASYEVSGVTALIDRWIHVCDVFVFSGFIRNFFLGDRDGVAKDLDNVVTDLAGCAGVTDYPHTVNRYGGVKFDVNGYEVDAWQIDRSFGIVSSGCEPTPENLVATTFFNYSAVAYDCGGRRFIVDDAFVSFLGTRVIDFVYGENTYPGLCAVCAYHYARTMGFGVSDRLRGWVRDRVGRGCDLAGFYTRHFGHMDFDERDIFDFYNII